MPISNIRFAYNFTYMYMYYKVKQGLVVWPSRGQPQEYSVFSMDTHRDTLSFLWQREGCRALWCGLAEDSHRDAPSFLWQREG